MSEQANDGQTPLALYRQRLEERQQQLNTLERRGRRMGAGKLLLAAATLALLLAFLSIRRADWLLALPVLLFVALAVAHERVLRAQRILRMAVRFYEQGVARLEDHWAGSGQTGEEYLQSGHSYARDLDLFGRGSLFELLSSVRTRAGAERLAGWLSAPAAVDEILARQLAVRELSRRVDFRERLATTNEEAQPGLHPEALVRWAEGRQRFGSRARSLLAMLLALGWVAAIAAGFALGFWTPALLVTLLNFALSHRWGKALDEAASQAEQAATDLGLLVRVLRVLEDESFACARLQRLQADLRSVAFQPSQAFARLERIVFHLEARRNPMLRVFDGLLFYSLQLTTLAEGWRLRHGASIARWIAAVGEMEALSALAGHAFEHPGDCFPEFVASPEPLFEAEALGHPLLPEEKAVRNSIVLGQQVRLMLLSGPNMAGKSTFLRGIGLNAVLAQCGAPVRARRLRMTPLALGASICVLDSLAGGISRFYAEIQHLKRIADLAGSQPPLLFLLDELLSGTNSHDRLKGSEYLVRGLVGRGAIGLVTTHDLALTAIPDELKTAANYHFDDRLEDGRLIFDYQLKLGVVQTSNALQLMQAVGLLGDN